MRFKKEDMALNLRILLKPQKPKSEKNGEKQNII